MSPEALREIARNMVETVPQASALGFKLRSIEPSKGSILTPWREDLVGDPDTGVIAGGVVTALLDHVCGLAIISTARWSSCSPARRRRPARIWSSFICTVVGRWSRQSKWRWQHRRVYAGPNPVNSPGAR